MVVVQERAGGKVESEAVHEVGMGTLVVVLVVAEVEAMVALTAQAKATTAAELEGSRVALEDWEHVSALWQDRSTRPTSQSPIAASCRSQ